MNSSDTPKKLKNLLWNNILQTIVFHSHYCYLIVYVMDNKAY